MEPTPRSGLADLVVEIEGRLNGSPATARFGDRLPAAPTYVLVLFDGLGDRQLDHPAARSLAASRSDVIDAPFPTTTTVSMATLATGLSPRTHGVIGHLLWLPDLGRVVNTLKWVTPAGEMVDYPTESLLPEPNLWERLARAGIEPITVQPGDFAATPLTRALYRGCRFEPAWSVDEAIEATAVLSRRPGRLIFTYFPQVDFAAHVWGSLSQQYREAMAVVDTAWSQLCARVPAAVGLVGTADHGHVDYGPDQKLIIRDPEYRSLTAYGDPRAVMLRGAREPIERLARATGAELVDGDLRQMLGPGPDHPQLEGRLPDALLLAPAGRVLLLPSFDKRLIGYHGGITPEEVEVPLLVR